MGRCIQLLRNTSLLPHPHRGLEILVIEQPQHRGNILGTAGLSVIHFGPGLHQREDHSIVYRKVSTC